MKRILLLFCALFLMLDLADDGCFGKANFVFPHGTATSSVTSSQPDSDKFDPQVGLPPANLLGIAHRFQNHPALVAVDCAVTIIDFYLLSSSGGLPL